MVLNGLPGFQQFLNPFQTPLNVFSLTFSSAQFRSLIRRTQFSSSLPNFFSAVSQLIFLFLFIFTFTSFSPCIFSFCRQRSGNSKGFNCEPSNRRQQATSSSILKQEADTNCFRLRRTSILFHFFEC